MLCMPHLPNTASMSTLPYRATLSLPTASWGRTPAPHPTNADHTVKNRASLLVPVSSGTMCSHSTGWQGCLGKGAGPEPSFLGTDTQRNE